ncbi:hypothetical protein KIN20_005171 [Parelaphostrongylus tenuis]|uniref:Uncharacterized protein n=1 Tax=Parelaphostrongylus tenuis TaxID=148309 RepID=A0AAD5M1Q9_PARTN|nr:hypothetical protein KIN20_005171 [Parelaphostrongylus tenuis]
MDIDQLAITFIKKGTIFKHQPNAPRKSSKTFEVDGCKEASRLQKNNTMSVKTTCDFVTQTSSHCTSEDGAAKVEVYTFHAPDSTNYSIPWLENGLLQVHSTLERLSVDREYKTVVLNLARSCMRQNRLGKIVRIEIKSSAISHHSFVFEVNKIHRISARDPSFYKVIVFA